MGNYQSQKKEEARNLDDKVDDPDVMYWDSQIAPQILHHVADMLAERPDNARLWLHKRLMKENNVNSTESRRHFVCAIEKAREQLALQHELLENLEYKIKALNKEKADMEAMLTKIQTVKGLDGKEKSNPFAQLLHTLTQFEKSRSRFLSVVNVHPMLSADLDNGYAGCTDKGTARVRIRDALLEKGYGVPTNYLSHMKSQFFEANPDMTGTGNMAITQNTDVRY